MRRFAIGILVLALVGSARAVPGVDEPLWPSRVSHRSEFRCGTPNAHTLGLELVESDGGSKGKLELISLTIDGNTVAPAVHEGVQAMLSELVLLKGFSAGCWKEYWIFEIRGEGPGPPATASKVFFATFSDEKFSQYQEFK